MNKIDFGNDPGFSDSKTVSIQFHSLLRLALLTFSLLILGNHSNFAGSPKINLT